MQPATHRTRRRRTRRIGALAATAAALLLHAATPVRAEGIPVSMELLLAVDASFSIDPQEFNVQMDGLAAAFRDPVVIAAISAKPRGAAVAVMLWGAGLEQRIVVEWTLLRDRESAEAFAQAIERAPRSVASNATAIGHALEAAAQAIDENVYSARKRVIDLSGDGRSNSGIRPEQARDRIVRDGVVINGLAILDGDPGLASYFALHVAGGRGSFVTSAETIADYPRAIRQKLRRELSDPIAGAEK